MRFGDGQTGLVLGLWDPRYSGLQDYVAELSVDSTRTGFVVDGASVVIAGPDLADIGAPLALDGVREDLPAGGDSGLLDTTEAGEDVVTTYARAGDTSWISLGAEPAHHFEGALLRSSAVAQGAVVALLIAAGVAMMVLHRKREQVLATVALRDELTGIYNRRGWFALAEHELERARRAEQSRVLVFVDVDGLKQVNDVLGHREGDRAIRDAARVLTAATRSSDFVGRLGGDEFVVLLSDGGEPAVARRRVHEALDRHNARSGAGFELRLSLGIEVWDPASPCGLDKLVRRAHAVMYVDKAGRPRRSDDVVRPPAPRRDAADRVLS